MRKRTRMRSSSGSMCTSLARSRMPWAIRRLAIWTIGASSSLSPSRAAVAVASWRSLAATALASASISVSARNSRSTAEVQSVALATWKRTAPPMAAEIARRDDTEGSMMATSVPELSVRYGSARSARI